MRVPSAKAQNRVSTKRGNDTLAPDMAIPRSKKNGVVTNEGINELCFSVFKQKEICEIIINKIFLTKGRKKW